MEKMKQQQAMDRLALLDAELGLDEMVQEANQNNQDFRKSDMS
jgi:hypothetical protein